jgi:hypothetical protein
LAVVVENIDGGGGGIVWRRWPKRLAAVEEIRSGGGIVWRRWSKRLAAVEKISSGGGKRLGAVAEEIGSGGERSWIPEAIDSKRVCEEISL